MSTANTPHYDVIIAGARCAGAATALLLARQGARVLVLDKSRYGTDTCRPTRSCGRVLQLHRWGLLPAVAETGTPPVRSTTFHLPDAVTTIRVKPRHGVEALYAPRRRVLDAILADAARNAGADVRFGASVSDLRRDRAGRVTGITGRACGARLWGEPDLGTYAVWRRILAQAAPGLAERLDQRGPAGPPRVFPGLTGYLRDAAGPGWALVGDAGYFKDPITAHGITGAGHGRVVLRFGSGSGAGRPVAPERRHRGLDDGAGAGRIRARGGRLGRARPGRPDPAAPARGGLRGRRGDRGRRPGQAPPAVPRGRGRPEPLCAGDVRRPRPPPGQPRLLRAHVGAVRAVDWLPTFFAASRTTPAGLPAPGALARAACSRRCSSPRAARGCSPSPRCGAPRSSPTPVCSPPCSAKWPTGATSAPR